MTLYCLTLRYPSGIISEVPFTSAMSRALFCLTLEAQRPHVEVLNTYETETQTTDERMLNHHAYTAQH